MFKKSFKKRPRKCLFYGTQGIGKSTACKDFLIVDLEDGSCDIECARYEPKPTSYEELCEVIKWLVKNQVEQSTIAFDSASWVDKLVAREVCCKAGSLSLAEVEYGKGGGMCVPYWEHLCEGFSTIIEKQGKNIVLVAHSKISKISPPGLSAFQRYEPDLVPEVAAVLNRWADDIIFYRWRTLTRSEDGGFGRERAVAIDTQERYLQTVETPSAIAKNRLNLPAEITSFADYVTHLPQPQTQEEQSNG
jgi:hypothetical protein